VLKRVRDERIKVSSGLNAHAVRRCAKLLPPRSLASLRRATFQSAFSARSKGVTLQVYFLGIRAANLAVLIAEAPESGIALQREALPDLGNCRDATM
jgi:hypothetical protein